jgi:hypothetical protein
VATWLKCLIVVAVLFVVAHGPSSKTRPTTTLNSKMIGMMTIMTTTMRTKIFASD